MGITERRIREKQQRSEDILDAAEVVFFEKGWQQATMDDVAARAELSKGTLYLYFKSKEELYLGINLRAIQLLYDMFTEAINSAQLGMDQLQAIGRAYFEFWHRHPHYFDTLLHFEAVRIAGLEQSQMAESYHEWGGKVNGLVAQSVANGMQDGTMRTDLDPVKTAVVLWGMASGMIQLVARKAEMLQQRCQISPDQFMGGFFDFVRSGLEPRN